MTEFKNSYFDDIKDFHERFGLSYDGPPRALSTEVGNFRSKFMAEELTEYITTEPEVQKIIAAVINRAWDFALEGDLPPLEKQLDALVDLVYVALGTAVMHGFDFDEAWRRVHAANMQKVRATMAEESARSSILDVVKPPGWKAPDLSDLVQPMTQPKPYYGDDEECVPGN
jgi:predicted HAD superfamily Cof-like phosphohydrolase